MGLFRKSKTRITEKLHRTDLIICTHSREGKTLSYSQINTVIIPPVSKLGSNMLLPGNSVLELISWRVKSIFIEIFTSAFHFGQKHY